MRALAASLLLVLTACAGASSEAPAVRVGSKKFTESVILGDLVVQLVRSTGARAEHRRELGGTQVLWQALRRGELDVYPEYTGTLRQEILAGRSLPDDEALRRALAAEGLRMSAPLGFNDTYALGMKEA
ncbi:MAG TPA: glycine betaine ABC transporter substrate-binding protein, partial [Myxococcaceae bacterium]|nr:glycine betaine ABC transporter substrate-binding protein [Myxococcaceae bacterium]